MADAIVLNGAARTETGKAANRRLRRSTELVPANVYGGGKDPANIQVSVRDLAKALMTESFYSQVLTLRLDGTEEPAIVREIQRHPATERVMHMDFLRIRADQVITVRVPVHLLGEDECVGVRLGGGSINQILTEVEVECLPGKLPDYLEVNVAELDIGDTLHLSDIPLPDDVALVELSYGADHDQPILSIAAPRGGVDEDEEDEEGGEEGAAEEGGEDGDDES